MSFMWQDFQTFKWQDFFFFSVLLNKQSQGFSGPPVYITVMFVTLYHGLQ